MFQELDPSSFESRRRIFGSVGKHPSRAYADVKIVDPGPSDLLPALRFLTCVKGGGIAVSSTVRDSPM